MVAALGTSFVNYFFVSAMPVFAEELTGKTVYGGLFVMAYSLAALAARPTAGIISDKVGRVKLLVFGALLAGVACVLYSLTVSIFMLLVIRALHGFGFGIHSTCAGAVVADVVPKARLSEGVGYFGIYATIGQAFAPWIAIQIIGDGERGNFILMFMLSAAICLVSAAADCLLTYERRRRCAALDSHGAISDEDSEKAGRTEEAGQKGLPRTIFGFELSVFAPALVVVLLFFAISGINSFLILYANWRGIENVGLYFTFSAIGIFISRFLFSRIADSRGSDLIVIPGVIAAGICLAIIPFTRSLTALVFVAFPLGIAQGAAMPTMQSIMFKRCSAQRRGTASAAYFAAVDIGMSLGAPILGLVADATSYHVVYLISSAVMFVALIAYIILASDKVFRAKNSIAKQP